MLEVKDNFLSFDNAKDFISTAHIHRTFPDSAFGRFLKLENGRFGFYVNDSEILTMLKLSV